MEKMATKTQVETRANLYQTVLDALALNGITNEPIKGGSLLDLGNGYHAKLTISVCDPEKVQKYLDEYAEQQSKNATRAAEKAAKDAEKARKASEKAAEKASK